MDNVIRTPSFPSLLAGALATNVAYFVVLAVHALREAADYVSDEMALSGATTPQRARENAAL